HNCSLKKFNNNENYESCLECKNKCYFSSCPTFKKNDSICNFNFYLKKKIIENLEVFYDNKKY
ncbi:hypothetical protein, partial [Cetobacterium sp.]|uniref:hypothetical protein n=1 Tax=Cetobacterium sp. TaxID=2071632 RepID=UPI003F2CCCEE